MGHKLVIWEGTRPADDAAGAAEFQAMATKYLVDEPVEPTPTIRALVETLTGIWTDDTTDPAWTDGPWKWPDTIDSASGPVLYLDLVLSSWKTAVPRIASIADEFGLVTFDLMFAILRPCPEEKVDAIVADMWREFEAARNPTGGRIRPWRSRSSRRSA